MNSVQTLTAAELGIGPQLLAKTPTGIPGLDDVTGGGLPTGRCTLVCGPAGCGKTLLGMEFLVRGVTKFGEPGVFLAFEESVADLTANVSSMGFDLGQMVDDQMLALEHIELCGGEMEETGDWDLEGLFLRLGVAIDSVGAKRVVIDTIENLFSAFQNTAVLRSELRRLFEWLKQRGVTAVITGERGEGSLTRHGIEEYVSDCVIVLDHRVTEQRSIRRLRILKYRGSVHGTDEYPFLIGEFGLSVLPIASLSLQHKVFDESVSTGVNRLDAMLGAGGFFKGSAVLVSGTAGTGKSTLSAQFGDATCARGERVIYFSFEESEAGIIRNMRSVGLDLRQWVDAGLMQFHCHRPSLLGLEAHLFLMQKAVSDFDPTAVVMDPISDLFRIGSAMDVSAMLTRQLDFLKSRGVTVLVTSLSSDTGSSQTDLRLTSLVDTWILVKTIEGNGEYNRLLHVLKSRGMAHSNQIREFLLTSHGIELTDVYVGPQGVLTGSARQAQEACESVDGVTRREEAEQRRVSLERRRESVEAQTAKLWRDFENEAGAVGRLLTHDATGVEHQADQRMEQARLRSADVDEADARDSPAASS